MAVLKDIARAKVNLTLRVLGRRPDGYHEIESIVAFADEGDTVTLEPGAPASVRCTGTFAAAIESANTLDKTFDLLRTSYPSLVLGAVTLQKEIPVSAGLGGGSADAAALLRLVRRANAETAATVDWHAIATAIGADVPVCFAGNAARMRGIGEQIDTLEDFPPLAAVIVNARDAVVPHGKTPRVFSALGARQLPPGYAPARPPDHTAQSAIWETIRRGRNDLDTPARALMPQIAVISEMLAAAGSATIVRLSGAGPSCFAVFETLEAAKKAAAKIAAARPEWWILPTMLG